MSKKEHILVFIWFAIGYGELLHSIVAIILISRGISFTADHGRIIYMKNYLPEILGVIESVAWLIIGYISLAGIKRERA